MFTLRVSYLRMLSVQKKCEKLFSPIMLASKWPNLNSLQFITLVTCHQISLRLLAPSWCYYHPPKSGILSNLPPHVQVAHLFTFYALVDPHEFRKKSKICTKIRKMSPIQFSPSYSKRKNSLLSILIC